MQLTRASMGPSPFSDGRMNREIEEAIRAAASMGPSPFSDGRFPRFELVGGRP